MHCFLKKYWTFGSFYGLTLQSLLLLTYPVNLTVFATSFSAGIFAMVIRTLYGLITMSIFPINFVTFDYDFLGEINNFDRQTLQLFGDLYLVYVLRKIH